MAVLGAAAGFRDVREWYTRIAILSDQVCLIEDIERRPVGTAFLVGRDIVLTAAHVIGVDSEYALVNQQRADWDSYAMWLSSVVTASLDVRAALNYFGINHGIGEQQPMGTIRSFVDAVLPAAGEVPAYYSKPDRLSELFELRRLQATGSRTDFYEYYWAYNVEGTKLWSVLLWMLRLMIRSPKDVPHGVRVIWWLSWALLASFLILVALGLLGPVGKAIKDAGPLTLFGALIFVSLSAIQFVLISYVGDAARYLSPLPANINLRQKIRSQGVQLLRALHASGKYNRIIIVGHSLGSVIGYDIISRLWLEYNEQLPAIESDPNVKKLILDAMAAGRSAQPIIRDELSKTGELLYRTPDDPAALWNFQRSQVKAWREQCALGNPWRVSDFITLGSPLAHAELLLAAYKEEFVTRKRQREIVTCPPQRDAKGYAYSPPNSVVVGSVEQEDGSKAEKRYTPLILHHAAPFAVTRWTNLYFPVKWGLLGDLVGGALASAFGPGIRDVSVRTTRRLGWTLRAHTSYWYCSKESKPRATAIFSPTTKVPDALDALRAALALNELRKFVVAGSAQKNV